MLQLTLVVEQIRQCGHLLWIAVHFSFEITLDDLNWTCLSANYQIAGLWAKNPQINVIINQMRYCNPYSHLEQNLEGNTFCKILF